MHFMSDSAISAFPGTQRREEHRRQTSRRITSAAQRLAAERGLDGFTMDELAAAADVSRRTLFNYFPGKVDAVLGEEPHLPEAALAAFLAGGPRGVLLDDVTTLAQALLAGQEVDREEITTVRALLVSDARLMHAVHTRFEAASDRLVGLVLTREGEAFGADRAALLLRLFTVAFGTALEWFAEGDERPIDQIFAEVVETIRDLFTPA